jgi:hypothetical protein
MTADDLAAQVLAHLHANSALTRDQLAGTIGCPRADVDATIEALVDAGHLEPEGDRLVPDAASHPTPGLFVATDRTDAGPLEIDYDE